MHKSFPKMPSPVDHRLNPKPILQTQRSKSFKFVQNIWISCLWSWTNPYDHQNAAKQTALSLCINPKQVISLFSVPEYEEFVWNFKNSSFKNAFRASSDGWEAEHPHLPRKSKQEIQFGICCYASPHTHTTKHVDLCFRCSSGFHDDPHKSTSAQQQQLCVIKWGIDFCLMAAKLMISSYRKSIKVTRNPFSFLTVQQKTGKKPHLETPAEPPGSARHHDLHTTLSTGWQAADAPLLSSVTFNVEINCGGTGCEHRQHRGEKSVKNRGILIYACVFQRPWGERCQKRNASEEGMEGEIRLMRDEDVWGSEAISKEQTWRNDAIT